MEDDIDDVIVEMTRVVFGCGLEGGDGGERGDDVAVNGDDGSGWRW